MFISSLNCLLRYWSELRYRPGCSSVQLLLDLRRQLAKGTGFASLATILRALIAGFHRRISGTLARSNILLTLALRSCNDQSWQSKSMDVFQPPTYWGISTPR